MVLFIGVFGSVLFQNRNLQQQFLLLLTSSFVFSASDYIIKEKTVLLQKKDSEGFGFVLRGAKGDF